ncbi:hypothetical protein DFR29_12352 [Tahibacter aquaticus]|uniref:Uncharacterized protein n=1 Tax=Tahibacter aquaticus TaxID=520092 RepID=A0A4R6YLA6_9GAMM|nr:hypothetical protein [Tahibacter aquaticus]TDR37878.1 hypothetical protein DFR29_12352 [Tahibacter aquaticus]
MATREQTSQALAAPANGWLFEVTTEATLRRPIFSTGDTFVFSPAGMNLSLQVTDQTGKLVLGKDLLLAWNTDAAAFTATAYGRHMKFLINPVNRLDSEIDWDMTYSADYEAAPHHSPDEGGDGDPK